jgi:hypothetical protein
MSQSQEVRKKEEGRGGNPHDLGTRQRTLKGKIGGSAIMTRWKGSLLFKEERGNYANRRSTVQSLF